MSAVTQLKGLHLEGCRDALALGGDGLHLAQDGLARAQQPLLLIRAQLQLRLQCRHTPCIHTFTLVPLRDRTLPLQFRFPTRNMIVHAHALLLCHAWAHDIYIEEDSFEVPHQPGPK